jgi:hypothetical protein
VVATSRGAVISLDSSRAAIVLATTKERMRRVDISHDSKVVIALTIITEIMQKVDTNRVRVDTSNEADISLDSKVDISNVADTNRDNKVDITVADISRDSKADITAADTSNVPAAIVLAQPTMTRMPSIR